MLGYTLVSYFGAKSDISTVATSRKPLPLKIFNPAESVKFVHGYEAHDISCYLKLIENERPDIIVNCIGIIKQSVHSTDLKTMMEVNSLFPHYLSRIAESFNSRLVHISTDCVFSGLRGSYSESDIPDPPDTYGKTKLLGEVSSENSVTIRTSLIGHEIETSLSLIDWFLKQSGTVRGYKRAIFSGLPTITLAKVLENYVFPNRNLRGLVHLAAEPISKYELLSMIASQYDHPVNLIADNEIQVDRSLVATKFRSLTGYSAPCWSELVSEMHEHWKARYETKF